ncbi:hypothetical protein N9536_04605 [Flavobacteriaceae bacterium]|nr:hypothetical protein [Flavobacteriaceae bacterium]
MNPSDTFSSPNYNWNGDFHRLQDDYELFYDDDGRVSQFRLHLKDEDPEIKNKCICVSKVHFKEPVTLFYERHKNIGTKKTYLNTSGNIKSAQCYPQNDVARYEKKYSNPACLMQDLQAKIDAQLYIDFSEKNTPTFVIEY